MVQMKRENIGTWISISVLSPTHVQVHMSWAEYQAAQAWRNVQKGCSNSAQAWTKFMALKLGT